MTRNDFNNLDLRKQLTNELKEKWYYQTRKWGLRINKHSVVFDKEFSFKLTFHDEKIIDDVVFEAYIDVKYYINDREDKTLMYCDDDKYSDDVNDILNNILVYIANYI